MKNTKVFKLLCYNKWEGEIPKTLVDSGFKVSTTCRHCNKEISEDDFAVHYGYWTPMLFAVHKSCQQECKQLEAYLCQSIDADCNDCKYFKRGKSESDKMINTSRAMFAKLKVQEGHCLKYDMATVASSNTCSAMECFEHRKS